MGISFEENFKRARAKALENATLSVAAVPTTIADETTSVAESYGIATADEAIGVVAAYDGWMKPLNSGVYEYYDEYSDDKISTVDEGKNVLIANNQINLTQEKNSQYIPFEIPRFYDGFDLSTTQLSIYWVNGGGYGGVEIPVNVYYNSDKVSFGWLVDDDVTAIAGKIKFEIQASGKNSLGYDYLWKTKPSEGLNVLQALEIKKFIEPDDTWQESFISKLTAKVSAAEDAALAANNAAVEAKLAADQASAVAEELNNGISEEVQQAVDSQVTALVAERITEALINYYTRDNTYNREQIDDMINNIDISDQLDDIKNQISNIDGLANFNVEYSDGLLTFKNGEEVIGSFLIPGADYLSAINEKVSRNEKDIGKHETSISEISADLESIHETVDGLPETLQSNFYNKEQTYSRDDVDAKFTEHQNNISENYYSKDKTFSKDETYDRETIDAMLGSVEVDLDDYATKKLVEDKETNLASSISANADNISSISGTVADLQNKLDTIDVSPRKTYDLVYNNLDDENSGENVLVFYEIENEKTEQEVKTVKQKYTIVGGGGGPSSSNTFYIYYDKDEEGNNITQYIFTAENVKKKEAVIHYDFSGTDAVGDTVAFANAVWQMRRGSSGAWTTINNSTVTPGTDIEFNASEYISSVGTYSFKLNLSDDTGAFASKSWSIQHVDLRIESSFNDKSKYPLGEISLSYTPYGSVAKDIHFILDGDEVGVVNTTTSGIPMSYLLPAQAHGAHLVEIYATATIQKKYVESNHIFKDIMWFDTYASTPVIGTVYQNFTARQYEATNIEYTVHHPNTDTPTVEIAVDGNIVSTTTLSQATNIYAFKTDVVGEHIITITCDGVVKRLVCNVTKLDIAVTPVVAGLAFDFNPIGKSNNDSDRLWSNETVSMSVSDNFDWVNGGYQFDESGDQYFCVKAGTTATINYNLFADDPKKNGKEFKVVFKTKNIRKRDTSFLTCMNNNIGLDMKVEYASVYGSDISVKSHYCENEIIEYEFNINKDEDMMIIMTYEDGTPNIPAEYKDSSSFKQTEPQPITIGSPDCDIHIYRMKAYSESLSDVGIMSNFIADARNADEMIARYNRNQIYDENNVLVSTSANGGFSADALMKAAPDLRYVFIEVPQFTNDKDNKIDGCKVYFRYPNGKRPHDNWDCVGVTHRGQGTSSNLYGYAGRNIDLCMDEDESLFTYTDENGKVVESSTITLTDTSVPTDYLNIKVNIASSENANNAELARRFNEYQPFLRYARKKNSHVKDTMEFYNCVVFIRETSENDSVEHREFNDTNWHFYAIGNIGDSKKTDDTRVNNKRDPKEHVVEIADADKPLSAFPTGKDGHAICSEAEWSAGNTAYDILHSTEYVYDEKGKFESFGGGTYEFRYEMKDLTPEQREVNINAWRDLYKFIVTSSDEEFYTNLKRYFVVDSALYYYLFTERYTMVDNRAKNSFWHYGKVYISNEEAASLGETEASYYIVDDEQAAFADGYRYDLTFGYDMDTALGIDNTGDLVFSYGKEDTDYYVDGDPSSDYVFRVADSVFFCRLRDLFPTELQAMFKDREEKNAWNPGSLISQWDRVQSLFPEELWRLDYERKYYRTYLGLSIDNSIANGADKTFLIGKFFGRKKYSRRQFETNQSVYMATKYFGNQILSDVFWIRGNVPLGNDIKPNYSLTLVPYSDMYVCVQYTSTGTPIHKKVKAGETCRFESDAERMDFIYVYAAGYIQEVGDLSRCYVGDNNFSSATRLQKLVIGSTEDGYRNTFMKEVLVDNNPLLEYLDLRNISGIDTVIDLSSCGNLKELYAEGTNASGVIFADGGLLEVAHLPPVNSLSMKSLNNITDFTVSSYENLQSLVVEYCPAIDTINIINSAPSLNILRLSGVNWVLENGAIEDGEDKEIPLLNRLLLIRGRDALGYETDVSVISGKAYTPVIRQKKLYDYQEAWNGLELEYGSLVIQFPVTFVNYDNSELEVQYVDEGAYPTDPVKRADNPIPKPERESSISTDYTYVGWNNPLTSQIFAPLLVTAMYSESVRKYTIKYVMDKGNKTVVLQEHKNSEFGKNYPYTGETPVYTAEENGYKFYLFNRWDKSGFIDGDKTVTAIFDEFKYTDGAFEGKSLGDLKPVEIYALTRLTEPVDLEAEDFGIEIDPGDKYSFRMGYDIDYNDIESETIISDKMHFDGTNHFDTGIKLFDKDEDFVLAIDYKISSDNTSDSSLVHCFQSDGSNGFKLGFSGSSPTFTWGSSAAIKPTSCDLREMIVIRRIKGDNKLYVYNSKLDHPGTPLNDDSYLDIIDKATITHSDIATLVFGAGKRDSGRIDGHCIGDVYWCKIWYKDLGDEVCRKLIGWTHEDIPLSVSGRYRYQLFDDSTKETMVSLVADKLLDKTKTWNSASTTTGGWASSTLNSFLNTRFFDATPDQIKAILKKMSVKSTIGDKSSETTSSGCYITIPSLYDVYPEEKNVAYAVELYDSNTPIMSMTDAKSKIRSTSDGLCSRYWLRSPNINYNSWVHSVDATGSSSGYTSTTESNIGILIEISF